MGFVCWKAGNWNAWPDKPKEFQRQPGVDVAHTPLSEKSQIKKAGR